MAFGSREIAQATSGQVGSTPPALLRKIGVRVLNVRGTSGVRKGRRRR